MPNMLIYSMFTASAMVVLLLLLKNTVDGFQCAEFQIVERFPRRSIHCMNMVCFPVLMFHLNEHVNNMWRNRKTFLKSYCVALLITCLGVSQTRVWRLLHDDSMYLLHPHHVQNLHPWDSAMHLEFCHWLHTNCQLRPLIPLTDEATFTHNGINNT
jgi:hypothetical protein